MFLRNYEHGCIVKYWILCTVESTASQLSIRKIGNKSLASSVWKYNLMILTMARCSKKGRWWTANVFKESAKLTNKEDDWKLVRESPRASRTMNGGNGRPILTKRYHDELSSSTESAAASMDVFGWSEVSSETTEEEVQELVEESGSISSSSEDSAIVKPPPHYLIVETESLKDIIEKNCRCSRCNDWSHCIFIQDHYSCNKVDNILHAQRVWICLQWTCS
jgi:hypothetical protein